MSNGDDSKCPTKIRENVLDVRDYVLVDEILIAKINECSAKDENWKDDFHGYNVEIAIAWND